MSEKKHIVVNLTFITKVIEFKQKNIEIIEGIEDAEDAADVVEDAENVYNINAIFDFLKEFLDIAGIKNSINNNKLFYKTQLGEIQNTICAVITASVWVYACCSRRHMYLSLEDHIMTVAKTIITQRKLINQFTCNLSKCIECGICCSDLL